MSREALRALDEESGPVVVFAEAEQTVFLADMSGDGLTDIVRIRNGEVSYWPNRGYGRFGARVAMTEAPVFDHPDRFDPARVRLAPITGTGPSDLALPGRRRRPRLAQPGGQRLERGRRRPRAGAGRRLPRHPGRRPLRPRHAVPGVVVAPARRASSRRCATST
ncbi:MAG: VCBS repeat-containing protein [Solirubrobacterales bacterium]